MSTKSQRLRQRAETLRNWRTHAEKIAEAAAGVLGEETRTYAFGSAVRGEATPSSDIDLLIIVNRSIPSLKARNKMMMKVEGAAGLEELHPFEIHIVNSEEAAPYFRHAGQDMTALKRRKTSKINRAQTSG